VNLVIFDSNGFVIVSVAGHICRTLKAEVIVHYDWGFLITLYACLMWHALYMTQPFTLLSSLILIVSGGRYNLCSHTLCSFLQFPITFSHKSLQTDQHFSQTQSTAFPQCHRTRVTPTAIKIPCKYTYVCTAIISFWKEEGEQNITKLQCAFLQIHLLSISSLTNPYCLMPLHNTSSYPLFKNFKNVSAMSSFYGVKSPS